MNHHSIARTTLADSLHMRNQGGMASKVPHGSNSEDSGPMSKPSVNTQPFNNERLALQNKLQNLGTASTGANVNATGQVRSQIAQASDAETKAQNFSRERQAEALYANQSGSAMMRIASMDPLEAKKFRYDLARGKAAAMGLDEQLAGEVATKYLYG